MNKDGHVLNAALLGIGLGIILEPAGDLSTVVTIVEVTVPVTLGALFPDVDTAFGKHRKTLHNFLVFGIFLAFPVVFGNLQFVWIGILTHYVLDLLGSRRGLALFWPWEEEFSLPLGVSTASKYATPMTLAVTAFELTIAVGLVYLAPEYLPRNVIEGALALAGF